VGCVLGGWHTHCWATVIRVQCLFYDGCWQL